MTDAFNTALDAYEAELNRIDRWTSPRFVSMSKNMPDAHGRTLATGMSRSLVAAYPKSNGAPLKRYGRKNHRIGNLPTMR